MKSFTSSVLKWPDERLAAEALRRWAETTGHLRPKLRRVGYFGSYARGDWGVGSDLDVLLVVAESEHPFVERAREWRLEELPVPADVIVYTEAELADLVSAGTRFGKVLDGETVWVWERGSTI